MSWTLHTSGGAIATAGANVNSTISNYGTSDTELDKWSDEAESFVCNAARYDLVTNYAGITASGKVILSSICDAYVAQKIINYEPESIGLTGAALRLNLLQTQIQQGLSQIENDKIKSYLAVESGN
jgi:hypothetical protein